MALVAGIFIDHLSSRPLAGVGHRVWWLVLCFIAAAIVMIRVLLCACFQFRVSARASGKV